MRLYHLLPLSAVAVVLLVGCSSSTNKATGERKAKPVVLKLANPNVADADVGDWIQAVERLSRGSIRIDLRSNWRSDEVHAERGTLDDLRKGTIDVAKIAARAWDTLGVKSFQALQAPLLVDSFGLERRVLTGPLGTDMLAGVRTAGVEPLAVIPGELRRPLGVTRDLRGPADYRGARIASRPSAVAAETARALGGRSYRDVAVGTGLAGLDAFDDNLAGISEQKYDRQARSVTADVVLWPRVLTLVINRGRWRQLTPAQRDVLKRAAREAVAPRMRDLRIFERGGVQVLCRRGFRLVHAGAAGIRALRRAVGPVYRRLEADPGTRHAIERIRELKADTPRAPVASCRSEAKPPKPISGPLVGTWHTHATRALMARARRPTGEGVDDNYGEVTLVLGADGRFEFRNARFPGHPMGLGTWGVSGTVLWFQPEGTVASGTGQTWRYSWKLVGDALVLDKLLPGEPTAFVVAPFSRG